MDDNLTPYRNGDAVIGQDEGGVDAGELGVGHGVVVLSQVAENTRL